MLKCIPFHLYKFERNFNKTIDWYLTNDVWLNNVLSGAYDKYYEKQYAR